MDKLCILDIQCYRQIIIMAVASGALSLLHGFALCTLEADAIAFNSTLTASGEALAWMHVAGPGSMVQWLYGSLGDSCVFHTNVLQTGNV